MIRGRFEATTSGEPATVAEAFIERWADDLGIDPGQLGESETRELDTNISVVEFAIRLGSVPVVGAHVRVWIAGDEIVSIASVLPTGMPSSLTPTVVEASAATTAAAAVPSGTAESGRLVVLDRGLLGRGGVHLAHEVPVRSPLVAGAPLVYVDASTGAVVHVAPRSRAARDRRVFDMDHETNVALGRQLYEEAGLIAGEIDDPDANEAFLNAFLMYDYFEATFGRDSGRIDAYVHYGAPDLGNAFALDGRVHFADGQMSEDIFAHEFAHVVIDQETGRGPAGGPGSLDTSGEPGAVHESIADIFAMLAGRRAQWHVGSDGGLDSPLRDLDDPGNRSLYCERQALDDLGPCEDFCGGDATCQDPDGTCDRLCIATTCSAGICYELPSCANDEGYVHENSRIFSHAVFLATRAGVVTSEGTGEAIGDAKMEQIVYRTVQSGLRGLMGLGYSAEAMIDACHTFAIFAPLFGAESHGITIRDCAVVRNAFARAQLVAWDSDFDGWPDPDDNCPRDDNPGQDDADDNGVGDLCDGRLGFDAGPSTDPACDGGGAPDAGPPDSGPSIAVLCPASMPTATGSIALASEAGPTADVGGQAQRLNCDYGTGPVSRFRLEWFTSAGPEESRACWTSGATPERSRCSPGQQAVAELASPDSGDGHEDVAELAFLPTLLAIAQADALPCPARVYDDGPCAIGGGRIACPPSFTTADGRVLSRAHGAMTCPVEEDPGVFTANCEYFESNCQTGGVPIPTTARFASFFVSWDENPGPSDFEFTCVEEMRPRFGAPSWQSGTRRARSAFIPTSAVPAAEPNIEPFSLALRAAEAETRAGACTAP